MEGGHQARAASAKDEDVGGELVGHEGGKVKREL
jgi:hypothetical protein